VESSFSNAQNPFFFFFFSCKVAASSSKPSFFIFFTCKVAAKLRAAAQSLSTFFFLELQRQLFIYTMDPTPTF
jgi:hypothetical protein